MTQASLQLRLNTDEAKAKLEELKASLGQFAQFAREAKLELNVSGREQLDATTEAAKQVSAVLEDASRNLGRIGQSLDGGIGNTSGQLKEAADASRNLALAGQKMEFDWEQAGRKIAITAGAIAASIGAIGGVSGAVRNYADFERTLAQVGSVAGATADELAILGGAAEAAGASTEFSASQAADGLLLLARAGFDAQQSIEALPGVLDLAIADALQLGEAADIAASAVAMYGLQARDLSKVADILVETSNKSNTGVRQMGEGLGYVGPVARALNVDLAETAALFGVLGDSGIQGSRAGTAIQRVLSGLNVTSGTAKEALEELGLTQEDLSLETNTLVEVLQRLKDAQIDAYDAEAIFGDYGKVAVLALTANIDKVVELTEANRESAGAAREAAEIIGDNLAGDYNELTSAAEAASLSILGGMTSLRGLTQGATETIQVLFGVGERFEETSTGATIAAAAVSGLALSLGGAGLAKALSTAGAAFKAFLPFIATNPFLAAASGIGLVAGALYGLTAAAEDPLAPLLKLQRRLEGFDSVAAQLRGGFDRVSFAAATGDIETAKSELAALQELVDATQGLTKQDGAAYFSADQFDINKATNVELASMEKAIEQGLRDAVSDALMLGTRDGVKLASTELQTLISSFGFETASAQQEVADLIAAAQSSLSKAGHLRDAASFRTSGSSGWYEDQAAKLEAEAAELAWTAVKRFSDLASLDMLTPEQIAQVLGAALKDAEAKVDSMQPTEKRSPRKTQLSEEAEAYRDAAEALREYLRERQFELSLDSMSEEDQAVAKARREAFEIALPVAGPLLAPVIANAIAEQERGRLQLAAATKLQGEEQEDLNRRLAEEGEALDALMAGEYQKLLQTRDEALSALAQLNQANLFEREALGFSPEQRRRAYEDEIAQQAALTLGAEEGSEAWREYLRLADEADFAARGQRAADFLTDTFSAFATQAATDFDSIGDAFEDLLRRLEAQVVNAAFQGLFQNLFSNLVGTSLGVALNGAFGLDGPQGAVGPQPGDLGFVGPLMTISPPAPDSSGKGLGTSSGSDPFAPKGLPGSTPGFELSPQISLGAELSRFTAALETMNRLASAIERSGSSGWSRPEAYPPAVQSPPRLDGPGLSTRQSADMALRRLRG